MSFHLQIASKRKPLASLVKCKLFYPVPEAQPERRSPCPIACALDLLGDRWTLIVVRDLFLGRRYFEEFLTSPEGIATNILSDRLKLLASHGLVEKLADESDRRRFIYKLTTRGKSLKKVLIPLTRWSLENIPGTRVKLKAGNNR